MMFKLLLLALALTLQSAHGKKALVIGHRGSSGYLPEHTLEAKVAAMLMGADYIEQDLVLTKDNIPIVIHDIYLDEVTDVVDKFPGRSRKSDNGEARYFAIDFTLAEIKQLQVTERFHRENKSLAFFASRYPVGQSTFQINTLEEEIQLVKGFEKSYNNIHKMASGNAWTEKTFGIYVELKRPDFHRNESKSNFSEIVLEIVNKYYADSADSQVFIQCFDPIELMRIKNELGTKLPLIQLLELEGVENGINYTYWNSLAGLQEISKFARGIGPNIKSLYKSNQLVPSEFYHNAKSLGLLIHPWTLRVDQLPLPFKSYDQLLDFFVNVLKVDGLFTDFPDITSEFIKLKTNSARQLRFSPTSSIFSMIICYFIVNK